MSEPVRVAHVMGKMVGGGVESVVMNYYRHIDRKRVQFDFIVDDDSSLVPRDEIEVLGGKVYEVPPYQQLIAYQRTLIELFREQGWRIVHSHINALSLFPLCAAKRAGVAVRIAHSHSTAGKGEYARNALKAVLKTQSNRYPTQRLACSRYAGEWLFGRGADFRVLHNAIDLSRFSFHAETRSSARAELGLSEGQLAILHAGRFMEQKNHRFLVDVFEEVSARRPDAVLLFVGDGGLRDKTEGMVAERGLSDRIMFLGQRDDVERLYMAADVFCLPSLYEGLPLVSVEAQRAGLQCLLSDSITREVDVTGTVRFLPIDNAAAWADEIVHGNLGERVVVDEDLFVKYDITRAAQSLTDYYLELVGDMR